MGIIMKYLVRPIYEKEVFDSIFETWNIVDALKKVEEQYQKNEIKCIIVGCSENVVKYTDGQDYPINLKHK